MLAHQWRRLGKGLLALGSLGLLFWLYVLDETEPVWSTSTPFGHMHVVESARACSNYSS